LRIHRSLYLLVLLLCFALPVSAQYGESPLLAERVEEGELPPIEDRLPHPDDIYVVEPLEMIGQYGGMLRTAGLSAEGDGDDQMLASLPAFYKPSIPYGEEFIPHLAKNIEASEDMTEFTINLRRGVRWSDGEPFTTEDILFWYEDILLNEDLTPAIGADWKADDQVMDVEVIDDYTIKFIYASAKPYFINDMIHSVSLLVPKHYMKQFHPNYASEDELDAMVAEAGFDAWYQLFMNKDNSQYALPLNPDLPTLGPFKMDRRTSEHRSFVRNPYYWKTDTEGNQLPYVDGIENQILGDGEIYNGMIISGQLDFAGFFMTLDNYPMYRSFEDEGEYETVLWTNGLGAEVKYAINQTHPDEALRSIFQEATFRQALSLAIDREEISEVFYFGHAEPRQLTVLDSHPYYKPEYADAWIEFDPERANQKLDALGLDERDSEGYRLRPDGERLSFTIETVVIASVTMDKVSLVADFWRENLDLDVSVTQVSGELAAQRAPGNMMDVNSWTGGGATYVNFPSHPYAYIPYLPIWSCTAWPEYAHWFQSGGESGMEPPDHIKDLRAAWAQLTKEPDAELRKELAQKILAAQAENVWSIGTVGRGPHPIAVNNRLRNVNDQGLWTWDVLWSMSHDPEQIFIGD